MYDRIILRSVAEATAGIAVAVVTVITEDIVRNVACYGTGL